MSETQTNQTNTTKKSIIRETDELVVNIDEAIDLLGMGYFQFQLFLAAGLCFMADAMEVLLLSFLSIVLQSEWQLSNNETASIISVVFAGALIGTLVLGKLADHVGRKHVFQTSATIIAVFGLATAFCQNYFSFIMIRFIVGFGVGGLTIPFNIVAEFLPSFFRGRSLLYIEFFWSGGTLLVPLFAWLTLGDGNNTDSWRYFVALCSIPCFLSMILGFIYVPESPRWLLTKGKNDLALQIMRIAAKRNGLNPLEVFPDGTILTQNDADMKQSSGETDSMSALFSPQWRRITMLLFGAWLGMAFLYYGCIISVSLVFSNSNDVNSDSYDFDYSAIFISAIAELIGLFLVIGTVDWWGRVATQAVSFIAGGISLLLLGIFAYNDEQSYRYLLIIFAFASRMFMMGASCTTWVITSEIFSTDKRTSGHSAANAIGRIGGFIAPYLINERNSELTIGFISFAVSIATSLIVCQLPETHGKAMGSAHLDGVQMTERKDERGLLT